MAEQEKDIAIRKEQVELQLQQRNEKGSSRSRLLQLQGLLLIKREYGGLGCQFYWDMEPVMGEINKIMSQAGMLPASKMS